MTQNTPRDERSPQRRLAEMERRIRTLETAPRAAATRVLFVSNDGPADIVVSPSGDGSVLTASAGGGVSLYTGGRTTDPPAPPADTVVLYVKGNRLYYRDSGGTVYGPL